MVRFNELDKENEKEEEAVVTITPKPFPLFPYQLKKKVEYTMFSKFISVLK